MDEAELGIVELLGDFFEGGGELGVAAAVWRM